MTHTVPPQIAQLPKSAEQRKASRLALVSSYVGSSLEMYDFLLYGTAAALVFPALFFNGVEPGLGVALSFVTLAAGYVARPIGGIIFGHFGDRLGRKKMLVITMALMGVVSVMVGLLPTSGQIGILAPIALVTLRVIQGIAMGGEWAGATLMSMEHSTEKRRGFGASIAVSGGPSGAVLATLVMGAFAALPEEDFMSWGWRVPFLLSVVLLVVGLVLRMKVSESPDFEKAKSADAGHSAAPIVQVLKRYPKELSLSVIGGLAPLFMQSLLATFALSHAVASGHSRADALLMLTIANAIHIFTIPAAALLSDKVGRSKVMLAGAVAGVLGIWPMFMLIENGSVGLLLLGFIIGNPLIQALMYGPMGAWMGEMFSTKTRYTGLSLSYQLAATFGAGFAPLIANALVVAGGGATTLLAIFFGVLCVVSAVAFIAAKDRKAADA